MIRLCMTAVLVLSVCRLAVAQITPQPAATAASNGDYPEVTFGVLSYLQYSADLHEAEGFNAFDVTRGFLDIRARLSPRVRFRFTPDVQPTTDADLSTNLALRLAYASLEADVTDGTSLLFGMHDTPWLSFEQSINRYRVQGPMFAERQRLIPGQTDLGASVITNAGRAEIHAGVYNGEGSGRSELDKYKSVQARVTVRPFASPSSGSAAPGLRLSAFYSHGWYARDRPRNVAIVMGSYEHPRLVATAQYLTSTDNPFVTDNLERRGVSFFGEVRQGPAGWAGIGRVDLYDPNTADEFDARRRFSFGGARWSQVGRGRVGVVGTFEMLRGIKSQLLERRLLAQTHVEF